MTLILFLTAKRSNLFDAQHAGSCETEPRFRRFLRSMGIWLGFPRNLHSPSLREDFEKGVHDFGGASAMWYFFPAPKFLPSSLCFLNLSRPPKNLSSNIHPFKHHSRYSYSFSITLCAGEEGQRIFVWIILFGGCRSPPCHTKIISGGIGSPRPVPFLEYFDGRSLRPCQLQTFLPSTVHISRVGRPDVRDTGGPVAC